MTRDQQELQSKLKTIQQIFNVSKLLQTKSTTKSIAKYYSVNKLTYTLFHGRHDFVHMGISRDGKYKESDLLEQVKLVEKYIRQTHAQKVLELGTGRGANSEYLALKYPTIDFYGIDLPDGQLDYAIKKSRKISNFYSVEGDFHNLRHFPEDTFNVVYVIESLCHSSNKHLVVREVKRVLKKRGVFIVIDGYINKREASLNKIEKSAGDLVSKGMLVEKFDYYPKFRQEVLEQGFTVIFEEDTSMYILPSLYRFEKLARYFFSLPHLVSRLLVKLFPLEFTMSAISGYLLPELVKSKIACYKILVLELK